jgi:hypothetical protein
MRQRAQISSARRRAARYASGAALRRSPRPPRRPRPPARALAELGAPRSLVTLAAVHDGPTRRAAAGALAALAAHIGARGALLGADVDAAASRLLTLPDPRVQADAARILAGLSALPAMAALEADDDGGAGGGASGDFATAAARRRCALAAAATLAAALQHDDVAVVEVAAAALANLAEEGATHEALFGAGEGEEGMAAGGADAADERLGGARGRRGGAPVRPPPPLLEALRLLLAAPLAPFEGSSTGADSNCESRAARAAAAARARAQACRVLAALATNPLRVAALVDARVVPPLVAVCYEAAALFNLSEGAPSSSSWVEGARSEAAAGDPAAAFAAAHAAAALGALAAAPRALRALLAANAPAALVALLHAAAMEEITGEPGTLVCAAAAATARAAAAALAHLAAAPVAAARLLARAPAVPAPVPLTALTTSMVQPSFFVEASGEVDIVRTLAALALAAGSAGAPTRAAAAVALANLAAAPTAAAALVRAGGIAIALTLA